ncbi:MAG TPA: hypothetical protein DEP53_19195 [Bacteroidetes bacterium]|nr:MAG: hypothetical protein A2X66_09880 [Ignavibacteria bacterium GWA2_54_16]HCA81863.1 hypothetical protein [Bacteroidota bacterium]
MNKRTSAAIVVGLIIVLALSVLNHWLLTKWFNVTYVDWYMKNGALVGLVTALVSLAWGDVNKHVGLISAHPLIYLGACLQLVGLPLFVMGTHMRKNKTESRTRPPFDSLVSIFLVTMLTSVMFVWLVVVTPIQYFVFLICGAPARLFSQSTRRAVARLEGGWLEITEIDKSEKLTDGWWDASIAGKPVPITNLFASLVFLILKLTLV